ncbi:sulfatase-like hydrolase/transferase [Halalkalibacter alkaliphilus]|uniref:Sulfatase-like hydrolase/transferase n=1 Tax=Halalkalibacter alkaliphilus TaxID=2917993 RepID=A0A9X2CUV7_9BACI|nr:sulfatase-like hydrolase/transferase [Halalkalibacter alkaliphilus]MCL7748472.1 sulfatase-like hydrolase/transferase [Halalkalibacter alkaliphilus]
MSSNNKSIKPNIIFITCDHLRADLLGCAGHPAIQTPHIDKLAEHGVRFSQAYSPTPVCIPARATMMTGLEGDRLGLKEYRAGFELPVQDTLPQQLRDAGYQTKVVGKMHVYPERKHYGFEEMLLCEEGRLLGENKQLDDYEIWLAEQGYPGKAFAHGLSMNEYAVSPWHLPDHLHPTEWIGEQACKQIKRRDWTRPLFLWTSFTAPHPPLTPLMNDLYVYEGEEIPESAMGDWVEEHPIYHQMSLAFGKGKTKHQKEQAKRAFYASVTHIDRQINRIIGTLSEEGMLDNTWIVFTADHGDNLGDHNLWAKSTFLKGSCNIPLIITPPYQGDERLGTEWKAESINHSMVGLQDILPTLVDIGGGVIPEGIDGRSLLPLVKDTSQSVREFLLGEFGRDRHRTLMVTDRDWKYIWYETDGYELLFNIKEDPNELKNLVKKEPEKREEYRQKLISILTSREQDPAVEGEELKVTFPGSKAEKNKRPRINSFMAYESPVGHH